MILGLLQRFPKRQYAMSTHYHMKKTQPHEMAEMEEKESHDWGNVTKRDTSFEDTEYDYWSEQVSNKGECISMEIARVKKVSK